MKHSALLMMVTFLACDKSIVDSGPYWGTASAIINHQDFKFQPYCIESEGKLKIYLDEERHYKYSLILGNILPQQHFIDSLGEWQPDQMDTLAYVFLASTFGGDVIEGFYHPDPGSSNFLEILEWNENTKEIRGSFNITMLLDKSHSNPDPSIPDTLMIENGEFLTRLQ